MRHPLDQVGAFRQSRPYMNALSRFTPVLFGILRLITGLLFACHGGQKLLGFPPGGHSAGNGMMLLGAWIELLGGFLIAFGLLTRAAAFIAAGEMAVAYYMHASGTIAGMMHKPALTPTEHFFPLLNGGELAVIYCFVFLFIFFHGAGRYALDNLLFRRGVEIPAHS